MSAFAQPIVYYDPNAPIIDNGLPAGVTGYTPQLGNASGGFGNESLGIPSVVDPNAINWGSVLSTGLTDALKAYSVNQQTSAAQTAYQNGINVGLPNIGQIFGPQNTAAGSSWVLWVIVIVVILFFMLLLFRHSGR